MTTITNTTANFTAVVYGKEFTAKQTNGKFFYWAPKAMRWLPVSKSAIKNV
jgi:hypothetical protein